MVVVEIMHVVYPIIQTTLSGLQFLVLIASCQRLHRYIASSDSNVNERDDTFTDGGGNSPSDIFTGECISTGRLHNRRGEFIIWQRHLHGGGGRFLNDIINTPGWIFQGGDFVL